MKITVCGSMQFAKEMLELTPLIEALGHEVFLPVDINEALHQSEINMDLEHCEKFDVTMNHFQKIEKSDAILVVNHHKNGINGYIGGSVLMEIGLAYYLRKKRFILHDLPGHESLRYIQEIIHMKPIILKGDLSLIQ